MSAPSHTTITPQGLSNLLLDPSMTNTITMTYADQPTTLVTIRSYLFLSQAVQRFEEEIERHRQEQLDLFAALSHSPTFRNRLVPILQDRYRRTRRPGPHPYARPTRLVSSSSSSSSSHRRSSTSPPSSPRFVTILSPEPPEEEPQSPISTPSASFHDVDEEPGSSSQHPIDVDQPIVHFDAFTQTPAPRLNNRQDTPHPSIGILRRTSSLPTIHYCNRCGRTGHTVDACIWRAPISCDYCGETNHIESDCVQWKRDIARYHPSMQYCPVCNQDGHPLERCWSLRHRQ